MNELTESHAVLPCWVVDGKDGAGTLVFDENSGDESQMVRVYGKNQETLARRIAEMLNNAALQGV